MTRNKSFDRIASCYDATRAMPQDVTGAVADGIVRALREVAPTPALLEIGVGTGRIAVPLANTGMRLVGIDIAPAMLAQLRAKRADLPIALADATAPPFRPASFDGALFVHVLHLLPDVGAALRAVGAVLRPGGLLMYGRTEHAESPRRKLIDAVRDLTRQLAGIEIEPARWNTGADEAFAEHARSIGAAITETVLARWTQRSTGRDLLDALARRTYSSSWAIPDAVMPELLRHLTPRIEEMMGLDRPAETATTFVLVTARVPR
jgi:ubiquinone/menaquinone biosynthesis C-methylase UbiE